MGINMDVFIGGKLMGGWENDQSKYKYAPTMAQMVKENCESGSKVLMLGLGGCFTCPYLNDFHITAVEIEPKAVEETKKFFAQLKKLKKRIPHVDIIQANAHTVSLEKFKPFAAVIIDIPSCYERGEITGLVQCWDKVDDIVVCNFFEKRFYTDFINRFNTKMKENTYMLKQIRCKKADENFVGLYKKVKRPTHQSIRI